MTTTTQSITMKKNLVPSSPQRLLFLLIELLDHEGDLLLVLLHNLLLLHKVSALLFSLSVQNYVRHI